MQYKLLILDVDGTIVPYGNYLGQQLPSERVTKAIREAYKRVRVCFATGRPLYMMEPIFKHLKMSGQAILNDGAQVIDIKTKKVYYERQMGKIDTEEACRILHKAHIPFYVHDNGKDIRYSGSYVPDKPYNIFTLEGFSEAKVDKIIRSLSHISGLKINKTHYGKDYSVLISHAEATKLHGIYEVATMLGVKKRQIIGVGDSGNDFPLLMASGTKVAMGNAIEDLKAVADYVAPSVDEDGVADVIEKFILSKSA